MLRMVRNAALYVTSSTAVVACVDQQVRDLFKLAVRG